MGTWGRKNFDSDTAADHLSILTRRLVNEIDDAMSGDPIEIEPDEYWGTGVPCDLELLFLLSQQPYAGVMLPDAPTLERWKSQFLAVWDRAIDDLEPEAGYVTERRAVLVKTFDQLAQVVTERAAPPAPAKKAPPAPARKAPPASAKKAPPAPAKKAPAKKPGRRR